MCDSNTLTVFHWCTQGGKRTGGNGCVLKLLKKKLDKHYKGISKNITTKKMHALTLACINKIHSQSIICRKKHINTML